MMASQEKRAQKGPCDILRTFGGGKKGICQDCPQTERKSFFSYAISF